MNIEINFPYNEPNKNGVVYTKEAIEKAFSQSKCPLKFEDNIIGYINTYPTKMEWDNDKCRITLNGSISYIVNEINNNIINDFTIISFDILE